jgi:hypothetical protein
VSIDDYLSGHQRKVDVIEVDVQGAEYLVLQGIKQTLLSNRGVLLLAEFWPSGMRLNGANPESYLNELVALGFEIHELASDGSLTPADESILERVRGPQDYSNLVCERKADVS